MKTITTHKLKHRYQTYPKMAIFKRSRLFQTILGPESWSRMSLPTSGALCWHRSVFCIFLWGEKDGFTPCHFLGGSCLLIYIYIYSKIVICLLVLLQVGEIQWRLSHFFWLLTSYIQYTERPSGVWMERAEWVKWKVSMADLLASMCIQVPRWSWSYDIFRRFRTVH